MNIILIGFKNSGKTTLGKKLAHKLNYAFVDTDRLLEKLYAQEKQVSLASREIYATAGEAFFRDLEKRAIAQLQVTDTVIATGGGSVLNPDNVHHLKTLGKLIYLHVLKIELVRRNAMHSTPAFMNNQAGKMDFNSIYLQRKSIYNAVADFSVPTAYKNNNAVLAKIIEFCGLC